MNREGGEGERERDRSVVHSTYSGTRKNEDRAREGPISQLPEFPV